MLSYVFWYTSVLSLPPWVTAQIFFWDINLIDYDAVSLAPMATAPVDFHQTVFPISSDGIYAAAERLAAKRRVKRAYTVR